MESGTSDWRDILPDGLHDTDKVQKVKKYAVSKGYLAEDELFPEGNAIEMEEEACNHGVSQELEDIYAEQLVTEQLLCEELKEKKIDRQYVQSLKRRYHENVR